MALKTLDGTLAHGPGPTAQAVPQSTDFMTLFLCDAATEGSEVSMPETAEQYIARMLGNVGDRDAKAILESTARVLRDLIAGQPRSKLTRIARTGQWSVVQILAHLADAEIVSSWRLRSILAVDNVPLQAFDQDLWSSAFNYADADPDESLDTFDINRRATLSLLKRVDPARLEHAGLHQERGREPIAHLIRLYAGHDLNHLKQIQALLAEAD